MGFLGWGRGPGVGPLLPPPLFKKYSSAPRVPNFLMLNGVSRVSEFLNFLVPGTWNLGLVPMKKVNELAPEP